MVLGLELDLPQPPHVGERPSERDDVAVDGGPEVPQPAPKRLAAERAALEILLEQGDLGLLSRVRVAQSPLAEDRLAVTPVHGSNHAVSSVASRRLCDSISRSSR